MHKTTIALILVTTALAACEPAYVEPTPPAVVDECGAAGYQGLIGQPRTALTAMNFPIGTRVIGPEDMVTADFRTDRLNIEYGLNGRITKVSCF
ncbi:I78 family peptidase inhibitor [Paracoccus sp. Ld10]|uniref:I78 family peptidase inhibitor n=1 Tax=Paracoccus sp. Ld10 TaxID=649158 RepID=UPI0038683205